MRKNSLVGSHGGLGDDDPNERERERGMGSSVGILWDRSQRGRKGKQRLEEGEQDRVEEIEARGETDPEEIAYVGQARNETTGDIHHA